jgi:hypothetical protein
MLDDVTMTELFLADLEGTVDSLIGPPWPVTGRPPGKPVAAQDGHGDHRAERRNPCNVTGLLAKSRNVTRGADRPRKEADPLTPVGTRHEAVKEPFDLVRGHARRPGVLAQAEVLDRDRLEARCRLPGHIGGRWATGTARAGRP